MKPLIFIICLLATSMQLHAQEAPKDILTKMVANVKAHQAISYTINLQTKDINGKTDNLSGIIHLQRDKADTIWGGLVWMSEEAKNYTTYSFYDKSKTYTVLSPISKTYADKPMKGRMGLSIQNNQLVWAEFLHPEAMERKYKNATNLVSEKDTTINGKSCYQVKLSPYYGESQTNETEILYINKADYFPILIKNITPINGVEQYSEIAFSNYAFDKAGPDQFSAKQIPANYKIETRDRAIPKNLQPEIRFRGKLPGMR